MYQYRSRFDVKLSAKAHDTGVAVHNVSSAGDCLKSLSQPTADEPLTYEAHLQLYAAVSHH